MAQPKKERASSRNLVRWSDAMDKKLLLTIQWACNQKNVKIPWDMVGREIESYVTGGAVVQHLAKLRDRMVMEGLSVPPPLTRGGRIPKAMTGPGVEKSRTRKRSKALKSTEKHDETSTEGDDHDYDIDRVSEGSQEYGESTTKRTKVQGKKRRAFNIKKEVDSESDAIPKVSRKRLRRALMPKALKKNTAVNTMYEKDSDSDGEERHAAGAGFWGWDGNTDKGLVVLKVGPKLAGSPAVVPQFERELSKASSDTYHSEHDSASLQLSEQTDNNNISPIEYHTYGSQGQVEGDHGKSLDSRTLGEDGFQPQSYGWNSLTGYHDHQLGLRVPTSTSQSEIVPQTAPYFEKGNFAESLSSTEDTWPGRIEMVTTPRDQEVYQLSVPQNRNLFYGASSSPFNGYAMDGGYHLGNRPRNDPYTLINSSLSATPMEPVSQQANAPDLHGDFANYQLQFGESNVSQQEQFFTNNNPHGLPNRGEWDNLLWPGEENDGRS